MNTDGAVELARQAIATALMLAAPLLAVGFLVALLVGLVQAVTQIQDQTISAVPKIIGIGVAIAVGAPWLLQVISEYTRQIIQNAPQALAGG